LPDHPGRAAYLGSDAFGWINPHGLWRIANGSYQPVSPGPQPFVSGLHRGIFLTDSGGIDAASGAVTAPQPVEILREGALQLQQNIRPKRVSAAIAIDGALRDATAPAGFAFDQRLGAARIADRPAVLTPLGIIGAESLDLAIAAPEATVRLDLEGDDLMAQSRAGQWHRLGPRGWQPSPPPHDSHVLARDAARIWKRRAGRAEIVDADPARPWGAVGQGLNFDADRIVAFGADATGLVAVTGIGTETATGFGGFAGAAAPVAPDPGAQRFLTQEVVPGRAVVAAETPGGWQIWDGTARSWRAPQAGEEPWKERLALRTDGLEIWFRAGKAEPFVTVTDPAGNSDLRPFGWAEGEQMPFDRVRAIHAEAGALLAGTDFGLRRFAAAGGGLRHEALFAHNGAPDAPPAVAALGRPVAATGEIQAAAGRACLTLDSIAANPRPCAAPAATDRLAVLQTPFWHWEKGRSGPRGSYLLSDGSHLPIGPSLTDRLPHDRLADRATC
ncbi:MAG: hypothetical protein JNJ84_06420, partial [Rhodobacteraceae bacterium]|nr:hypothetical protein [Paracoccaceae bacterium]